MSEGGVDLSQIRGDWKFHMDYLTNAITQTMKRQMKFWNELPGGAKDGEIDEFVTRQNSLWEELIANADANGTIPTQDTSYEQFIAVSRNARSICDTLESRDESEVVEEFAEACRQTRALCDDLEMMRDQRVDA